MVKIYSYPPKDPTKTFPKLRLFDVAGPRRSDCIRAALYIGGVPFEDVRFDFTENDSEDDDPTIKFVQNFFAGNGFPFWDSHNLHLEIDGKLQFMTISDVIIFAGRLSGLGGVDQGEESSIRSMLANCTGNGRDWHACRGVMTNELTRLCYVLSLLQPPKALQECIPPVALSNEVAIQIIKSPTPNAEAIARLIYYLKKTTFEAVDWHFRRGKGKHLVGDRLSIADLGVFSFLTWLYNNTNHIRQSFEPASIYPWVGQWKSDMLKEKGILDWIAVSQELMKKPPE